MKPNKDWFVRLQEQWDLQRNYLKDDKNIDEPTIKVQIELTQDNWEILSVIAGDVCTKHDVINRLLNNSRKYIEGIYPPKKTDPHVELETQYAIDMDETDAVEQETVELTKDQWNKV